MNAFETPVEFGVGPDAEFPYAATVAGARWVLRVNDFPAEPMWTLLVDDVEIVTFDNDQWPAAWKRYDYPA